MGLELEFKTGNLTQTTPSSLTFPLFGAPALGPSILPLHTEQHLPASWATCTTLGGVIFFSILSFPDWSTDLFSSSIFSIAATQPRQPNMPPRRQASSSVAANDEAHQRSAPLAKLLNDHDFADTFQGEVSRLNIPFERARPSPSLAISEPMDCM